MIGSTIGPYRVIRKIGEGGMGAVYEAVHEAIERRVALKVLYAEYAANKELARRFFNEARAVNRVEHPGLVEIYDFGHFPDNKAYIVMELLKGETLTARLCHPGGPMPVPEVLWIGRQVADALAAAHAKNVIHRDLKPDNVMIIPDPYIQRRDRTKLLDFGIAKLDTSNDSAPMMTRSNTLIGTPAYMSPEQCRGAGLVDDKSDVYSFGIMLYAMLTGSPPFAATGLVEIVGKHLYEEPPSLASRAPFAPERLTALVHSLLKKDKAQRPAMSQVSSELQALLEQQPSQRVSSWRQVLVRVGALCALGTVGVCGLPALTGLMIAQRPSPHAVSTVCDQPAVKASQPPAATGRGDGLHVPRKRGTADKPTAPRPIKHAARQAHERL